MPSRTVHMGRRTPTRRCIIAPAEGSSSYVSSARARYFCRAVLFTWVAEHQHGGDGRWLAGSWSGGTGRLQQYLVFRVYIMLSRVLSTKQPALTGWFKHKNPKFLQTPMSTPFLRLRPRNFAHVFSVPLPSLQGRFLWISFRLKNGPFSPKAKKQNLMEPKTKQFHHKKI